MGPCMRSLRRVSFVGLSEMTLHFVALVVIERFLTSPNYGGEAQNPYLFRWLKMLVITDCFTAPISASELLLSLMIQTRVLWTAALVVVVGKTLLSSNCIGEANVFHQLVSPGALSAYVWWLNLAQRDDTPCVSSGLWIHLLWWEGLYFSSSCGRESWDFCRFRWLIMLAISRHFHCSTYCVWTWLIAKKQCACSLDGGGSLDFIGLFHQGKW